MSDPNTIREEKPILSLSVYLDRVDYTIDNQNLIALCRACGNDTVLNGYIAYLKSVCEKAYGETCQLYGDLLSDMYPAVSGQESTNTSRSTVFVISGEEDDEEVEEDED